MFEGTTGVGAPAADEVGGDDALGVAVYRGEAHSGNKSAALAGQISLESSLSAGWRVVYIAMNCLPNIEPMEVP